MHKLNYKKIFLLGFGFFAISITWSVYNSFMPIYLSRFIEKKSIIGFVMTIDNYFSLFLLPIIGYLSDRINTRVGKRMPFIMIGMPLAVIFVLLIPNYSSLATLIICLVMMNLSMSIFRTPVIALMPDLTHVEHRSKANSIINFMGGIGSLIAFFIGGILWDLNDKLPFYLAGILMFLSFIVIVTFIKEKKDVIKYEETERDIDINDKHGYIDALNNKSVVFMLLAICTWFIAYNGIESLFSLYVTEHLNLPVSDAPMTLAMMSLSFLIFAIPAGMIGTKIGKRKAIMIGLSGIIICFGIVFLLKTIWPIRIVFFISGCFWSLVNINSYPLITQMAPKNKLGTYTGLYYLFSSIAFILSPLLLGWLIDNIGFGIMFLYGLVFMAIALVFIYFVNDNVNNHNPQKQEVSL